MQSLSSVQEMLVSPGNWFKQTTWWPVCNTSNTRGILMVRLKEHRLPSTVEFFSPSVSKDHARSSLLLHTLHGISSLWNSWTDRNLNRAVARWILSLTKTINFCLLPTASVFPPSKGCSVRVHASQKASKLLPTTHYWMLFLAPNNITSRGLILFSNWWQI